MSRNLEVSESFRVLINAAINNAHKHGAGEPNECFIAEANLIEAIANLEKAYSLATQALLQMTHEEGYV